MSTDVTTTDNPQPAHGFIPVGFGSKLGAIGAMLMALAATLTAMLPGDQTGNTQLLVKLGAGLAAVTVFGRVLQAVAEILKGYERSPKVAVITSPQGPSDGPLVDQSTKTDAPAVADGDIGPSGVTDDDVTELGEITLEHEKIDHHVQGD